MYVNRNHKTSRPKNLSHNKLTRHSSLMPPPIQLIIVPERGRQLNNFNSAQYFLYADITSDRKMSVIWLLTVWDKVTIDQNYLDVSRFLLMICFS